MKNKRRVSNSRSEKTSDHCIPSIDDQIPSSLTEKQQHQSLTVLLEAASSVNAVEPMVVQLRRQRNRLACRKAREKRRLEHRDVALLVKKRQERHSYLTLLANRIANVDLISPREEVVLFRNFHTRSMHYALIDVDYMHWSQNVLDTHSNDVQGSLLEQWRAVIDGYVNVNLFIRNVEEMSDLSDSNIVTVRCTWHFIAGSQSLLQACEIYGVTITGETLVRFRGRNVDSATINVADHEENAPIPKLSFSG